MTGDDVSRMVEVFRKVRRADWKARATACDEELAALDHLQARLEAAEADVLIEADVANQLQAELDEARAEAEKERKRGEEQIDYAQTLEADAEMLAEALRASWPGISGESYERPIQEVHALVSAALAAHDKHLTGPTHKPGTFYTTEDAQGSGAGDSLRGSGAVTPGPFPPPAPDERLTWRGLAEQLAGSLTLALADALGEDDRAEAKTALAVFDALYTTEDAVEEDVGPPAPGEGDDLPNPEVGMVC